MKSINFTYYFTKRIFYLCFIICSIFVQAEFADAHRVNLFAWVEGDIVFVEGKFSGGKPVNAGKITVTDAGGNKLLTGTMDDNGKFSFKLPKKTDLKIVLDAGEGHRADWSISASEMEMPITEKRKAADEGIPVKNMFFGIGCIFGLAVIIAYIRNRRKNSIDPENTKI